MNLLSPQKELLFAYGTLQYEKEEKVRAASVPGQLRKSPEGDACARFDMPGMVHGMLLRVSWEALGRYDRRETGYQRLKVTTMDGQVAWAYHYQKPGWVRFEWIRDGRWKDEKKEKAKRNVDL